MIISNWLIEIVLVQIVQISLGQNLAPRFEPSLQYNYFFPEFNSSKPGHILFWLNATDYDDDDLQFGVEGDFYNKLIKVKKIDGKHAQVIANQIFDREVQEKYENIFFYVKDKPGNKVYQSVRFVILDIDDNPPVFKNTPYKIDISENTPVNTIVFDLIEAIDADGPLYNKFYFSLNSDYFKIEKTTPISSGHYKSELRLVRELDYEKVKSHIFDLVALGENSPHVTSTQVIVNIIDYPDSPPEFSQSPYYVKIEEELPIGAFVLKITAKDGDTGINNQCKYKLVNENNPAVDYFHLDSLTGDLTIAKRIDLESEDMIKLGGLLEFKIAAIEIGDEESTSETLVTVAIFDLNDNKPKFDAFIYNLKISPKSLPSTSLALIDDQRDSIHVFDLDKGINGSFSLFLLKVLENNDTFTMYDDSNDFEVVPKIALNDANLIIKLKDSSNLIERMGKTEHYHIFAKDNGIKGNITYANLMIKIDSINQYAPQFEKEFYIYYLDENSLFNTTIAYLTAYDNDTLDNFGQVYYELKNGQDRFQIEKETGRIYTISTNPLQQLDRELIDTFYISVDAIDLGGLRTSVQIIIKLNDVNDNPPHFLNNGFNMLKNSSFNLKNSNLLVGFIEENSYKWLEPIKLQSIDRDMGINSAVVYEIIGGDYLTDYFKIDNKTNTIALKDETKLLDFEEIREMHSMKNYLNLKSTLFKDYLVFDNKIELDSDETDVNLIIMARDLGTPSLSSKIMVKIIVKDTNDHKPKFSKKYYTTQVLETAKSGVVFQVNAIDLDAPNTLNSKVNYRIESGGKDKFFIDSNTGWVKITENALLDRDLFGTSYLLKIIANDFGTLNENLTQHSSYRQNRSFGFVNETDNSMNICYLKIEILDVNNKKPEFTLNQDFVAKVSENSPIGTNVVQEKAVDPDLNPNLRYFLAKSSNLDNDNNTLTNEIFQAFDENRNPVNVDLIKNWFDIEPMTGFIFVKSKLDREFVEQISLVIGVEDLNASIEFSPQISTTVVRIKITDANDNYPIFPNYKLINPDFLNSNDEPIYEAFESIEENTKINTKLLQLKAIDLDKKRNVSYKLVHTTAKKNLLLLDSLTGEVFVNGEIDHEVIQWINLTIIAFDNGTPYQKHTLLLLHFKIEDLNDNEPTFVSPHNSNEFYVYESSPANTIVAKFLANDSDSGQFGTVFYRLISGDDGKFSLDPQAGILYVKTSLDREEQDLYTLVIQARDNPAASLSQQLSNSLLIKIKILDINDNKPYCENDQYWIETVQNVEVNTSLLQIKAIDKDIGSNAQIRYSLKMSNISIKDDDLFKINPINGLIQIKKKLTGHSGMYSLLVVLKDNENELISNSGDCIVNILIKDFNSHPPKFIFPDINNPTIRIKQSLPIGSNLITINATDPDATGQIVYYFDTKLKKNSDWKSFNIGAKTGILTLNTKLDLNKQSTYTIDIIASDNGKPAPLNSRLTLTIIVVDDSNNAAQFNRMQICLSDLFKCDSNFQSLKLHLTEETLNDLSTQSFRLAKINDITKNDDDICYYLSGRDKDYFELDKTTAILKQKYKLDRESRGKYELIIKATENCNCLNRLNESDECSFISKPYDPSDQSQLALTIHLDDINDNAPKFAKKFYQIGLTSETQFGEIIFDSFAIDLDSNSSLMFKLINESLINSLDDTIDYLPFKLEFSTKLLQNDELNSFKQAKFQLKSQKHFRDQDFNINQNRNNFYQFNITVMDQDNKTDTATIQIVLINKQQRIKLVFAQPVDKVINFQDEFRMYINNLTGYLANIDKISLHRGDDTDNDDTAYETTTFKPYALTDMFLHFVKTDSNNLCDWNSGISAAQIENNIVNADTILNLLDRSKDIDLLRKFKLSLAEKYDDQGVSTFYKYGSTLIEDDFFSWTSTSKSYSSFITRLILSVLCVFLLVFSVITVVICCCMRYKYKKKMKTEKALIKAFGLDQRSLSYNDAISGYVNSAFDSNSLLPIPGTNLYSYEGSNPIWLRKYDKIEAKNQPSTSSSGSSSNNETKKTISTNSTKSKMMNTEDCSSFYLKQSDTTPATSRCSSSSDSNNQNEKSRIENLTLTSEILSIKDTSTSPNSNDFNTNQNSNNINLQHTDTLLTFASVTNASRTEAKKSVNSILYLNDLNEDSYKKKFIFLNQSNSNKDCTDLFEVESTVI